MFIIYALLVFLVVIVIHEFGHFFVAKSFGISVNEFSVGMGPLLLSKKKDETQYSLRAIPIGGYVALEGEEEKSVDPKSFNNAHPFKRILVLLAGAFMNFVLAVVLAIIVFSISGTQTTTINQVMDDSAAYEASIKPGDTILKIDNIDIKSWDQVSQTLNDLKKENVNILIERNGEKIEKNVNLKVIDGNYILGITPTMAKNTGKVIPAAFSYVKKVVTDVYRYLGNLFSGNVSVSNLSGPVGIVKMIGSQSKEGFLNVLLITSLISANLGAFNLLPFPALDGGTILITFLEWIIGKEIPENVKTVINIVGFSILILLIVYVTIFNDLRGIRG